MRVVVDADATPNLKEIVELARTYNKELIAICDTSHEIEISYGTLILVDSSSQNTDVVLYNLCQGEDLVITQDYGLASLCLSRGCQVLNPNGFWYSAHSIDTLLEQNRTHQKLRKQGIHLKGPKKRSKEITTRFLNELENQLKNC